VKGGCVCCTDNFVLDAGEAPRCCQERAAVRDGPKVPLALRPTSSVGCGRWLTIGGDPIDTATARYFTRHSSNNALVRTWPAPAASIAAAITSLTSLTSLTHTLHRRLSQPCSSASASIHPFRFFYTAKASHLSSSTFQHCATQRASLPLPDLSIVSHPLRSLITLTSPHDGRRSIRLGLVPTRLLQARHTVIAIGPCEPGPAEAASG
jgi:hypothetical protein